MLNEVPIFPSSAVSNSFNSEKAASEDMALDAISAYERTKDPKCLHHKLTVLATCQIGSKFLQRLFSRSTKLLDKQLLDEIMRNVDILMIDLYGNYFMQTLLVQLDK